MLLNTLPPQLDKSRPLAYHEQQSTSLVVPRSHKWRALWSINTYHTGHADMAAHPLVIHADSPTPLLPRLRRMELAPARFFLPCSFVLLAFQAITIGDVFALVVPRPA